MSFRGWGPKLNGIFSLSVTNALATCEPTVAPYFAAGGDQAKVSNSGPAPVAIAFYSRSGGTPALAFPTPGNAGESVSGRSDCFITIVLGNSEKQVSIPLGADSFCAISNTATAQTVFVQRGDGVS